MINFEWHNLYTQLIHAIARSTRCQKNQKPLLYLSMCALIPMLRILLLIDSLPSAASESFLAALLLLSNLNIVDGDDDDEKEEEHFIQW